MVHLTRHPEFKATRRPLAKVIALLAVFALLYGAAPLMAGEGKGYLGVNIERIEIRSDNPDESKSEVRIRKVLPESPAAKAGLEKGDIILRVGGEDVNSARNLVHLIREREPGEVVNVDIIRGGEDMTMAITLDEHSPHGLHEVHARKMAYVMPHANQPYIGITMDKLGPQLADFFKVDHGVLIKSVVEASPAEAAGLAAGDIILSMNGEAIKENHDIIKLLRDYQEGDEVALEVRRRDDIRTITVTLGQTKDAAHYQFFRWNDDDHKQEWVIQGQPMLKKMLDFHHPHSGELDKDMKALREQVEKLQKQLEELQAEKDK